MFPSTRRSSPRSWVGLSCEMAFLRNLLEIIQDLELTLRPNWWHQDASRNSSWAGDIGCVPPRIPRIIKRPQDVLCHWRTILTGGWENHGKSLMLFSWCMCFHRLATSLVWRWSISISHKHNLKSILYSSSFLDLVLPNSVPHASRNTWGRFLFHNPSHPERQRMVLPCFTMVEPWKFHG